MNIQVEVKDRNGNKIHIGDFIEIFDWAKSAKSLGIAQVIFDEDEGRVSCWPVLVEDSYDFWTKALPRSRKVLKSKDAQ